MNQNLINKYKIELKNKVFNFETGKEIHKSINTTNGELTTFLNDWRVESITDYLIPETEKVLNGVEQELETGSETITIFIKQSDVDFYDYDGDYVNSIPTQDFKEIIIGWRDFLLTPPLNGTKMP